MQQSVISLSIKLMTVNLSITSSIFDIMINDFNFINRPIKYYYIIRFRQIPLIHSTNELYFCISAYVLINIMMCVDGRYT